MSERMSEKFMERVETILDRGMASVPLPAPEPVHARYRMAADRAVRRPATRVVVGMAAIGVALLTSVVGAAAVERESPITVVSTAIHSIGVQFENLLNPAASAPAVEPAAGTPPGAGGTGGNPQPTSAPVTVPLPSPEPGVAPPQAGQPTPNPSPALSDSPAPAPSDSPAPTPSANPTPGPSDNPTPSPGGGSTGENVVGSTPTPSPAPTPDPGPV